MVSIESRAFFMKFMVLFYSSAFFGWQRLDHGKVYYLTASCADRGAFVLVFWIKDKHGI